MSSVRGLKLHHVRFGRVHVELRDPLIVGRILVPAERTDLTVFRLGLVSAVIAQVERVWMVKKQVGLDLKNYFKTVLLPIFLVGAISAALSYGAHMLLNRNDGDSWIGPICAIAASMIITTITFYAIGTTKTERKHAWEIVWNCLAKLKKQSND